MYHVSCSPCEDIHVHGYSPEWGRVVYGYLLLVAGGEGEEGAWQVQNQGYLS
jgi:hypothetical protein